MCVWEPTGRRIAGNTRSQKHWLYPSDKTHTSCTHTHSEPTTAVLEEMAVRRQNSVQLNVGAVSILTHYISPRWAGLSRTQQPALPITNICCLYLHIHIRVFDIVTTPVSPLCDSDICQTD